MDKESEKVEVPGWYWPVVGLAFFWNLFGLMQFVMQFFITEEVKATMPEPLIAAMDDVKLTSAFAVAVIFGVLGCVMLFFRKKWALPLFVISLVGILAQNVFTFLIPGVLEVLGGFQFGIQAAVIIVAILLIWLSRSCSRQGLLT